MSLLAALCLLPGLVAAGGGASLLSLQDADAGQAAGADSAVDFDIPAQPLAQALKQYAAHSNRPTLFRGEMVAGRVSSPVHGRYSPEAALHQLLAGTGLMAHNVAGGPSDALILKEVVSTMSIAAAHGVDRNYGAWVQARVLEVLCADPLTVPGRYRSLLRFEVDAVGQVRHPQLLATTGDAKRDAAVLAALQRVRVERAPPPDMAQPLTMIVLPGAPHDNASRCDGVTS